MDLHTYVIVSLHRLFEQQSSGSWIIHPSWVLCGHRKPWVEVMWSNSITVRLYHINAISQSKLTLNYQAYDRELNEYYKNMFYKRKIANIYFSGSLIRTRKRQPFLTSRFQISTKPGEFIYFNSSTWGKCYGRFTIYDGFDFYHILYENFMKADHSVPIGKSTMYFQAHVLIKFDNLNKYLDQKWKMSFNRVRNIGMHVNDTQHFTLQTIQRSSIINLVIIVNFTNNNFQPKLSIRSRVFHGFNEENCAYGGIIITQTRDDDMLKNDTFGPYCNSPSAETLFLTSVGTTNITFSKKPFVMFVYAFNPLYIIDLDITFTKSQCDGILNPVTLCPVKLNISSTTMTKYVKHNYDLLCNTQLKVSEIYLEIILRGIVGCLIVQQIPSDIDISYALKIIGYNDVTLFISTPTLPQAIMNRTKWDVTRANMRSRQLIKETGNKHVTYNNVPHIHLVYFCDTMWHKVVYYLEMQSRKDAHQCGVYNETSHTLWQQGLTREKYVLAVTEMCGAGRYILDKVYIYSFSYGNKNGHLHNRNTIIYIYVTNKYSNKCFIGDETSKQKDFLTILMSNLYTSTIPVHQESYYITFYAIQTVLLYEKNILCSHLEVKFGYGIFQIVPMIFRHRSFKTRQV